MKKLFPVFLVLIVLFSSCTSFYIKKSGQLAEKVADSVDRGEYELPSTFSTVPFIFEGEILVTTTMVDNLWEGLISNGFTLKNPVITSIEPVSPVDQLLFRNSWEMEVFFNNTIPEYTYKISVEGLSGSMLLLIYRNEDKGYSILGLKADMK